MKTTAIVETLSHYTPKKLTDNDLTAAAVLILLIHDTDDRQHLLLTKRSEQVATYVGDYCFPGGMQDATDADLSVTAAREINEELHLLPEHYQIIGRLDDCRDRYGHRVRPFVATISATTFAKHHHVASDEIASLYYFPLDDLPQLSTDPALERLTRRRPSYSYRDNDVLIWGLTATMMVMLGNILYDLKKPVALVPQPD